MNSWTGVFTEAVEVSVGDSLHVENRRHLPIADPSMQLSSSYFDGSVLQLFVGTAIAGEVIGSAVLIAPGIAMTAHHTIDEHRPKLTSGSALIAYATRKDGTLDIWEVRHFAFNTNHDLTILSLERRSALNPQKSFGTCCLSTRTPNVGEVVMISGFTAREWNHTSSEDGPPAISIGGELKCATGVVSQVYLAGRDRAMIPWPCFEVNIGAFGGMSGGPVFDGRGEVIGLLCSAMGDAIGGTSYVSMLYPVMFLEFKSSWPAGLYKPTTTLIDIDEKLITIIGKDAVRRTEGSPQGKEFSYYSWTSN